MKSTLYTAVITALLMTGSLGLNAQTQRTDWNGLDAVTIYQTLHASEYKTLYILPIDDSAADYFQDSNEKTMAKVKAERAALRPEIQKYIQKAYKKLNVKLVDTMPANLADGEMALSIIFTEYNLGSAAMRAWVGAGNAGLTLQADFTGAGDSKIVSMTHRHKTGLLSPNAYDKVIKKMNQHFSEDFVTLLKALEKEK